MTSGSSSLVNSSGDQNQGWTDPVTGVVYPPQRHAGKVGYGPNLGSSVGDKIVGVWEEVRGSVTHNPILVKHGQDMFSGELKRKKLLEEDENDAFGSTKDTEKSHSSSRSFKETAAEAHIKQGGKRKGGATKHLSKKK
ncbi:hypothetical protein BDQ17DRAFT_1367434 [Cyathus striatus]|nr:hypothetical protein BDQ17DRAFT_1367434 [Cyathus striatus]